MPSHLTIVGLIGIGDDGFQVAHDLPFGQHRPVLTIQDVEVICSIGRERAVYSSGI